jgi:multidrug efflux pump subunit AcrA (membrane-fusion protein)
MFAFFKASPRSIPGLILILAIWWVAGLDAHAQKSLVVEAARKSVTLNGYTRSAAKMKVTSEVAGKVLAVHYDVGQTIGEKPFVEIDPTFIQFQIDQVIWTLKKLRVVKERAASRLTYLEKEFQRIDQLLKGDATTRTRFDAAEEELDQARLELMNTDMEIGQLKSRRNELLERRKRHKVMAPRGWVVVDRHIEPGEIVAAGALLARAADFEHLVVPIFVSGEELDAIRRSGPLSIQLEGMPAEAALNWVNPEFDERTRKLPIELAIHGYKGPRRGGLLTELILEVASQGLMVPKAAVKNRFNNPRVILRENGPTVPIIILGEDNGHIHIAHHSMLSPGTRLQEVRQEP